ncbi:hypothetical protein BH23CHL7_BH23CHL7_09480 [soil metagenome]
MRGAAWSRLPAAAGMAGAATIGAASLVTAFAYVGADGERYSPLNHWISELGWWRAERPAAMAPATVAREAR